MNIRVGDVEMERWGCVEDIMIVMYSRIEGFGCEKIGFDEFEMFIGVR